MDAILRALVIYLILWAIFRVTGKRTMAQVTMFDFVLLLVISEATQQALLGEDFSVTHAALVILTLIVIERLSDYIGFKSDRVKRASESSPRVLISQGNVLTEALNENHITVDDILAFGRQSQGIATVDEIDYAVLETSGSISVIPKSR